MAHINLDTTIPGIRSLVLFRPETGKPLYELVQVLLRGPSTLSEADRELIAAYVSQLNDCSFCRNSHAAAATALAGNEYPEQVLANPELAGLPVKIKKLMSIAAAVQRSGRDVTNALVDDAKKSGATDREVHDVVLIAATFSMFNRYVDGLATMTPEDPAVYQEMGIRMSTNGYVLPQKK